MNYKILTVDDSAITRAVLKKTIGLLDLSISDISEAANGKEGIEKLRCNPVDIVFSPKRYNNQKFDLNNYIDKNAGFISEKSKDGKDLKALELPGLWNGAMADWNTIFVEVPIDTFNPVKIIADLLRKNHLK